MLNIPYQSGQHSCSEWSTFIIRMLNIHCQNIQLSLQECSTFIVRILNTHCQKIQHSLPECSTFNTRSSSHYQNAQHSISEVQHSLPEVQVIIRILSISFNNYKWYTTVTEVFFYFHILKIKTPS